jgi:hypothetical protein
MACRPTIDFDDGKSCDLVLPYPPNWTAVGFFGILGLLHLTVAGWSFWGGQYEGHVSLILGTIFIASTLFAYRFRYEVGVLTSERRLRVRTTLLRSILPERSIPFDRIQSVRVFVPDDRDNAGSHGDSQVEIVCDEESIDCPQTSVPRQQALCLAMAMGVRLIKVCGGDGGEQRTSVPEGVPQEP